MERKLVVEAKGLSKKFADQHVVKGINFEVFQGECFGILGPDAAGKSTLMKMMYGSSSIHGGELFVSGLNVKSNIREIKTRIGVLPQDDGFDGDFTVRENLQIYGSYFGIPRHELTSRIEELIKLVRIEEFGDQLLSFLSAGLKRRVGLARALINQPEILFLDEPSSGMDRAGRNWMWDFLKKVKSEMGSVVLTTHYMEEAEQICDRIAILHRGQILAIGEPKKLVHDLIGIQVVEFQVHRWDLQYYLSRLSSQRFNFQVVGDQVNVHLHSQEDVQKALGLVQSLKVTIRQPTLSDVFLKLSGQQLREEPL